MGKIFSAPKEWAMVRDMTARGWRIALFASLGAMVFGYDTAWWSGVLGMPAFTSRYGVYSEVTKKWAISSPLQSSGTCLESNRRGGLNTNIRIGNTNSWSNTWFHRLSIRRRSDRPPWVLSLHLGHVHYRCDHRSDIELLLANHHRSLL